MKRTLFSLLAALCLTLILLPATAEAANSVPEGLEYEISGEEVTITDYFGSATPLTIPATIEGKPVTTIGYEAFLYCWDLISVSIPDSVTSIASNAFRGCSALTSVTIPDSVTEIGESAFQDCDKLSYNKYDNAYYLGNAKNPYVALIAAVDTDISSCQIHTNTKVIYAYAFSSCDGLTSITIRDSVTYIGGRAFAYGQSLTSVTIPDSVTEIGNYAFSQCNKLSYNKYDNANYLGNVENPYVALINASDYNISSCQIHANTKVIVGSAFYSCDALESVTIPNNATYIGDSAFYSCDALKSVTVGDNVTYIGSYAFEDCTSLGSVTIPNSVTEIGRCAFSDCTSLESVTIGDNITDLGDSVTAIGGYAFSGCTSLTSVTIGDSVSFIDGSAFEDCTALKSVTIPDSVTYIEECVFCGCTALESVTLPDSDTYIAWNAFMNCNIKNIYVTSIVAFIENEYAQIFPNNNNYYKLYLNGQLVTKLVIPDGITDISSYAFENCTSLTSVTIPNSVTEIGVHAFRGCTSLESVTIPDSVTEIGSSAFAGCTSLESVTIPDSVTSISSALFSGCTSLTSVTIPDSVTFIDGSAFYGCTALTEIIFPKSITKIGDTPLSLGVDGTFSRGRVFKNCTALKKITFLGDLPYISDECFSEVPATAYYPCGNETWTDTAVQMLAEEQPTVTWKPNHKEQTVTGKAATCTATGLTDGKKCSVCGTVTVKQQTIAKLAHSYKNGVCTKCSAKDPNYVPPVAGVDRVYGSSRYDTAFQSADTLKKQMGVEKFSCAIVTSGDNFADALAGSYLAYVKNAPILLTDNDNIGDVMAYIQKNVASGATVYALGGKAVVTDKLLDLEKKGYDVKRLAGKSRFETNLEILKECGSVAGKDILVCTGFNFADSLSASAAKRPILLVDDKLTDGQKAYLKQQSGCKYCIVGGTGAVTSSVEKSLKSYGSVSRLAGSNRFETSVMVAKKFFSDPTTAVLAYGYNFPDGLCAGPLAATINAPLILTATGDEAQAAAYAKEEGIKSGYVLGGSALINDKAVKKIFSMDSGDKIK